MGKDAQFIFIDCSSSGHAFLIATLLREKGAFAVDEGKRVKTDASYVLIATLSPTWRWGTSVADSGRFTGSSGSGTRIKAVG